MELEQRHRRTAAVGLAVAVLANLVYALIVPLGDSAAQRLDESAANSGLTALAVVLDVLFRAVLALAAVALARVVRDRSAAASLGAALLVAGCIASVLINVPYLLWAEAPADATGRKAVLDAVDSVTGSPVFLAFTVGGLVLLTAGATVLLIALRPPGWAPNWVLVAFLGGGVASLAGANVRLSLVAGAFMTGAALGDIAVQVARPGTAAGPSAAQVEPGPSAAQVEPVAEASGG